MSPSAAAASHDASSSTIAAWLGAACVRVCVRARVRVRGVCVEYII